MPLGVAALTSLLISFLPAWAHVPNTPDSKHALAGLPALACQAILCLSSTSTPSACSTALQHYEGIEVFGLTGLDLGATTIARRIFLSLCPVSHPNDMSARLDAIAQQISHCDPQSLNRAYATTAYRYRALRSTLPHTLEVQSITTVRQTTLPRHCTRQFPLHLKKRPVRYVGDPLKGGYWIWLRDYRAAQARWQTQQQQLETQGWTYSWEDPRHTPRDH